MLVEIKEYQLLSEKNYEPIVVLFLLFFLFSSRTNCLCLDLYKIKTNKQINKENSNFDIIFCVYKM